LAAMGRDPQHSLPAGQKPGLEKGEEENKLSSKGNGTLSEDAWKKKGAPRPQQKRGQTEPKLEKKKSPALKYCKKERGGRLARKGRNVQKSALKVRFQQKEKGERGNPSGKKEKDLEAVSDIKLMYGERDQPRQVFFEKREKKQPNHTPKIEGRKQNIFLREVFMGDFENTVGGGRSMTL